MIKSELDICYSNSKFAAELLAKLRKVARQIYKIERLRFGKLKVDLVSLAVPRE